MIESLLCRYTVLASFRDSEMRTHVTFQADFPKDTGPGEPAGRELAQHLATLLGGAGLVTEQPQIFEDYAYIFTCRQAKHTFTVFVGLVDDGVQEWLVYVEPRVDAVGRLLQKVGVGAGRKQDSPALGNVCTILHQCLRADPHVRSVQWYTAEAWDNDLSPAWSRTPD